MTENKRYISIDFGSFRKYGTPKEIVKMLKNAGFTAYDATMFTQGILDPMLFAEDWEKQAKEFRAYTDELGIVCNQSHAPFASARINNDEYNEWMFPRLVRAIEVSGILGAKVCVVHPCNDWDKEKNAQLYKRLEPYARKAGVKIGLENMWNCDGWGTPDFKVRKAACSHHDDFKEHLDLLPSDVFVACLDMGHAEMRGLETSAVEMIETLGDRLEAIHLHDVDLTNDNHQMPFTQGIDFTKVIDALKRIGYKGDITLETSAVVRATPKDLMEPLAKYLAAIANFFKNAIDE